MSASPFSQVWVYTYVGPQAVLAGRFEHEAGIGTFTYAPEYLAQEGAYPLDPLHLPLRSMPFSTKADGGYPGVFLDCCPQEWGQRIAHLLADKVADRLPDISPAEFLSVNMADPQTLMILGSGYGSGCLRFHVVPGLEAAELEPSDEEMEIVNIDQLPLIAETLARAEQNLPLDVQDKAYLAPGMSIGGARPKCIVRDGQTDWIAKFHRVNETVDIQLVEFCVNQLAKSAGIRTADSTIEVIDGGAGPRTVFLSRRFDRAPDGSPLHYISAASLLRAPRSIREVPHGTNLAEAQAKYSYADIAKALRRIGSNVREDLEELYRRMAFNCMIGNRDDHLCNHGFILEAGTGRYRLSPAFDLALHPTNPLLHPIAIGREGRKPTLDNVLSIAPTFGLRATEAREIIHQVDAAVSAWRPTMIRHGVKHSDLEWVEKLIPESFNQTAAARPTTQIDVPQWVLR